MSNRLEEIMDAIAHLRDEYVDAEVVSEYYGHDITGEMVGCPTSALAYAGDYIELLQKRVQKLEKERDEWKDTAQSYYMTNQKLRGQNKRYREATERAINENGSVGDRRFVVNEILEKALEAEE